MEANYWQYYLSFEEDVDRLFRYIEPAEYNFAVYSVELTRLYLAICSEIDVILPNMRKWSFHRRKGCVLRLSIFRGSEFQ